MRLSRTEKIFGTIGIVLAAAATTTYCRDTATTPVAVTFSQQFDSFWRTFDANYSYFEYKGIDWSLLRIAFEGRARSAPNQRAFVEMLTLMTGPLRDVHVTFIDPYGTELPTWEPEAAGNFDPATSKAALASTGFVQLKPNLGFGRIGGVGYIQVTKWDDSTMTKADLDAVLARFRDEPQLVIDVRMNRGGDDSLAYDFAARFNAVKRVVGYFKVRNGPHHGDFDPEVPRVLGVRGPFQFSGRVLVLAGRSSFSANESFIAAMRELPNVAIVGDTTGGGSGDPQTFELGGGYKYTVSRWIEYTADRRVIEWNGIPPDLFVPWDPTQVHRGLDPVLETALTLLGASSH